MVYVYILTCILFHLLIWVQPVDSNFKCKALFSQRKKEHTFIGGILKKAGKYFPKYIWLYIE